MSNRTRKKKEAKRNRRHHQARRKVEVRRGDSKVTSYESDGQMSTTYINELVRRTDFREGDIVIIPFSVLMTEQELMDCHEHLRAFVVQMASGKQPNVHINWSITGFDADRRELYEIPRCRAFARKLIDTGLLPLFCFDPAEIFGPRTLFTGAKQLYCLAYGSWESLGHSTRVRFNMAQFVADFMDDNPIHQRHIKNRSVSDRGIGGGDCSMN